MRKSNERVEKAQNIALERLDYIIDVYETPDFVEVVGKMGGDTLTYRIDDDGEIYER